MTPRRVLAWCFLSTLLLSAPALAAPSNPESDPSYQQAIAAYEKREWTSAIALFSEALGHYPSVPAYANRGNAYSEIGDYDRAMEDYNRALLLNNDGIFSQVVPIYYCRATLYYRKQEYAKAEADLNFVMARINAPALLYLLRGQCRRHLGKLPEARRDFAAAVKRDPDNADAALALLKSERTIVEAAVTRRRLTRLLASPALERKPSAQICNTVAWFLATVDDPALRDGSRALAYATKACELTEWKQPGYIDTLAAACAETGDFPAAVKWAERYLAESPITDAERPAAVARLELYRNGSPYHAAD